MGVAWMPPIPGLGNVVVRSEDAGAVLVQRGIDLLPGPDIELALLPFAVGVLARIECPVGTAQIPQDVIADALDATREQPLPCSVVRSLPRPEQCRDYQRLIVEHLLKVRHEPVGIGSVTVQAASQVIVDPAQADPFQSELDGRPEPLLTRGPGRAQE